jgi:hypothetical protein
MAMNRAGLASGVDLGSAGGLAAGPRPTQPELKALKELRTWR